MLEQLHQSHAPVAAKKNAPKPSARKKEHAAKHKTRRTLRCALRTRLAALATAVIRKNNAAKTKINQSQKRSLAAALLSNLSFL
jgi:Rod binding domain-containing protein